MKVLFKRCVIKTSDEKDGNTDCIFELFKDIHKLETSVIIKKFFYVYKKIKQNITEKEKAEILDLKFDLMSLFCRPLYEDYLGSINLFADFYEQHDFFDFLQPLHSQLIRHFGDLSKVSFKQKFDYLASCNRFPDLLHKIWYWTFDDISTADLDFHMCFSNLINTELPSLKTTCGLRIKFDDKKTGKNLFKHTILFDLTPSLEYSFVLYENEQRLFGNTIFEYFINTTGKPPIKASEGVFKSKNFGNKRMNKVVFVES
jgi:hypothetical protein